MIANVVPKIKTLILSYLQLICFKKNPYLLKKLTESVKIFYTFIFK